MSGKHLVSQAPDGQAALLDAGLVTRLILLQHTHLQPGSNSTAAKVDVRTQS
jgi:hypothetical protein